MTAHRAPPEVSLTRSDVREIDRRAVDDYGLSGLVLMENAGRNAAALLERLRPTGRVAILCGRGNNAGDGFVIARHLDRAGREVRILLAAEAETLAGDAAVNLRVAERAGIPIVDRATADAAAWQRELAGADVLVDALLGTGAAGPPRDRAGDRPVSMASAITAINAVRGPGGPFVLAIDLPSGLECDTGEASRPCVEADATGTFVARKRGFDRPASARFTGPVHVLDIGVPRRLLAAFGVP
jgi:NAD(P)H-hydrate epimerase